MVMDFRAHRVQARPQSSSEVALLWSKGIRSRRTEDSSARRDSNACATVVLPGNHNPESAITHE